MEVEGGGRVARRAGVMGAEEAEGSVRVEVMVGGKRGGGGEVCEGSLAVGDGQEGGVGQAGGLVDLGYIVHYVQCVVCSV